MGEEVIIFEQQAATLFKKWTRWVVIGRRIDSAGVLLLSFRYLRSYLIISKMVSNLSNVFVNEKYSIFIYVFYHLSSR